MIELLFLGAWEKIIHEKNLKKKSRDTVPLSKRIFLPYISIFIIMQRQLIEMGSGGEAPPQQYPDHPGQDGGQGWRSIQTADGQVSKPESGFGTGSARTANGEKVDPDLN